MSETTHNAVCKFCKRPLTLVVDKDYADLGDPFNLFKLAACNSCADYAVERGRIFRRVKMLCELLIQKAVSIADMAKVRESLESLIKRYMRLYAEHHSLDVPDYDPAIVNAIWHRPDLFSKALRDIPSMFQQRQML